MTEAKSGWRRGGCILAGLLVFGLTIVCALGLGLLASSRQLPTSPNVDLIPSDGGLVRVDQAVIVFADAQDPDGIAEVEFWINGELVGAQINPEDGEDSTFAASQSWRPAQPGDYLLRALARDRQGYVGQSDPVLFQAVAGGAQIPSEAAHEYVFEQGDTLNSIADSFNISTDELLERNPGLGAGGVVPGGTALVPLPSEEADDQGDEDLVPVVGAAGGRQPGGGSPVAASPLGPPGWLSVFNPDWIEPDLVCRLIPGLCALGLPGGELPAPPTGIMASSPGSCLVEVVWTDASEDEDGFRIYRFPQTPATNSVVGEVAASQGSGTLLSYIDAVSAGDTGQYSVAAVNAAGEAVGVVSEAVAVECAFDSLPETVQAVEIEALGMTAPDLAGGIGLYCYVSIQGAPHERVPFSQDEFLAVSGSEVDIAAYLGGDNKQIVLVDGSSPLMLEVKCIEHLGTNLNELGVIQQAHPPAEWDGRALEATSDSGAFNLRYSIRALGSETELRSGVFELVDGRIPPPYNLRINGWRRDCQGTGFNVDCSVEDADSLMWDHDLPPADFPLEYEDIGFLVYKKLPDWDEPKLHFASLPAHFTFGKFASNTAPLFRPCLPEATYYVSMVLKAGAEHIESPLSRGLKVEQECMNFEFTLEQLEVHNVRDGLFDKKYEAYGLIIIEPAAHDPTGLVGGFAWNGGGEYYSFALRNPGFIPAPPLELCAAFIDCPGVAFVYYGSAPFTTSAKEGTTYLWDELNLMVCPLDPEAPCTDFATGNNRLVIPFTAEESDAFSAFEFRVYLLDYDSARNPGSIFHQSEDIWFIPTTQQKRLAVDEVLLLNDVDAGSTVTLRVRGITDSE